MIFNACKYQCIALCLLLVSNLLHTQMIDYQHLSLQQAVGIGLKNNKNILISHLKQEMSVTKEKDLKMEKLPDIEFHTSYNQVTNLFQHQNGVFNEATKYDVINGMYDFTLSASIPVYMGGRIKNTEKKAAIDTEISGLRTHLDERQLTMEIITAFLQIHHLKEQQSLINDKMKEDSVNIKQVKALKANGVVTVNEVLRTSLQLSNHKMSWTELDNDVQIAEHKLKTILSLPENQEMHADTEDLISDTVTIPYLEELTETALHKNESVDITYKNLSLKELDRKITKANYLPKITAGGEYFLKYPNMMFFPPEPYAYRLGMLGVNLTYPIENLYKNKYRMQEAKENIDLAKLQIEENDEKIRHSVYEAYKKFEETDQKVKIAEEAIDQAKENYRIVRTKYANKLSLITELIDADNTYLEAESNLISVKINRQLKYYQLQYTIGNL
ncbi:outer membrane protein TolC [Chryseobacterium rhizosphaerae]|uniref:Outer membrane protein TolC n=1 Tax=Chryseobacterium rhizosphaerae TaxID=395937 RepID=A0AAE4BZP0_9FLAO|nr:TolC family protein [Chryseobacterium rhizosphaerae]MDR6524731.1 outer membrane protein TolC [Chryseobacterium rhizosphaerae]